MIDIAIIAVPADRKRAEVILDGLHDAQVAGVNRTRFITLDPLSSEWIEAVLAIEQCPCVIFCWSNSTAQPDGEPLRALGQRVLTARHAISVLLDAGTLPPEMKGSTVYPLHGWLSTLGGWGRFVFGNSYLKQIAAAAARKVSGQDPPPPQAVWVMIRAQAWALLLGTFALLGSANTFWGIYNDTNIAKLTDTKSGADFKTASEEKSCPKLRSFIVSHQGSAWTSDAQTLVASCHIIQIPQRKQEEKIFPAFGETEAEAEVDSKRLCDGYAQTIGGHLISHRLEDFVASKRGSAHCLVEYQEGVSVEVMGK